MQYFTIRLVILMLQSAGSHGARVHAPNVELLKHAYDKDLSQLTLLFGFFAPLTIGVLTLLVKTGSDVLGSGWSDDSIIVLSGLCVALAMLIAVLGLITFHIRRLKTEFADLRLSYFYLDRAVP